MDKIQEQINIADISYESVVDGVGIRFTIFTQGCPHKCEGCHNPTTHDFNGGHLYDVDKLMAEINKNPLLDGVTFSGGEPFCHAKSLAVLAKKIKANNLNIWCYSGYTLEELNNMAKTDNDILELLSQIDVLIDGKFILSQRNLLKRFKGSDNQRIINLKKMREENSSDIILLD